MDRWMIHERARGAVASSPRGATGHKEKGLRRHAHRVPLLVRSRLGGRETGVG